MGTLNKVLLMGYVGANPELKTAKNGEAFCKISLATHQKQKDENGEYEKKTTWHSVHVFGRQAEWACQRLLKGSNVFVEASIDKKQFEGDSGAPIHKIMFKARNITGASDSSWRHGNDIVPLGSHPGVQA